MEHKYRKAIFVSITKSLRGEIEGQSPSTPTVDRARGFWRVGDKADDCELLVAVDRGLIAGVWEVDRAFGWQPMKNGAIDGLVYSNVNTKLKYCQVTKDVTADMLGKPVSVLGLDRMCWPFQYNF